MINVEVVPLDQLLPHPVSQEIYGDPHDDSDFTDLVEHIRIHGVIEPILATLEGVIINGRRRWEAAREAGLCCIPVQRLAGLDDTTQRQLIITFNWQRKRVPSVMVREALTLMGTELAHPSSLNGNNGHKTKALSRLATRVGFPNKKELDKAQRVFMSGDEALIKLMDKRTITTAYRKLHSQETPSKYSSIIKPSDNWNFSPVRYPRIDTNEGHGYIPGDIYANCFWYFVNPGDTVVDAMAGSGMARYVYERRTDWMGEEEYEFDLRLFDLTPQASGIQAHDLTTGFPIPRANYIFIDPPYLNISKDVYSDKPQDLANMGEAEYRQALNTIAQGCAAAQQPEDLCTIISPNYVDHNTETIISMVEYIRNCWQEVGYSLYFEAYSSRRIQ